MMEPETRFCTSSDGVRLAYATMGEGPPLVEVPSWIANPELDWEHPDGRAFMEDVSQERFVVWMIARGVGASQREVDDLSLDAKVSDITAVVDHIGLDQFDLFGNQDGAVVSAAYAAQHPERVSRLVLLAPYPRGEDFITPAAVHSLAELIRQNWGMARRAMLDTGFPSGPTELHRWLSKYFRQSVAPEVAARCIVETLTRYDARQYLPQVKASTLVLHRRGERNVPIAAGRAAAALIPDARFVAVEGDGSGRWPAHSQYMEVMREFLDAGRAQGAPAPSGLVTILFTDMESSTALTQSLGDAKAQELVRAHNAIVRDALNAHGGSEITHTGDGLMASFPSASGALACAIAIQRAVAEQEEDTPLRVRVGLNAGEPVAEEEDLFGTAVQLARRVCDHAEPAQIVVSDVVRQLAAGKDFLFADLGETELRGFEDPVRLYEVRWQEDSPG